MFWNDLFMGIVFFKFQSSPHPIYCSYIWNDMSAFWNFCDKTSLWKDKWQILCTWITLFYPINGSHCHQPNAKIKSTETWNNLSCHTGCTVARVTVQNRKYNRMTCSAALPNAWKLFCIITLAIFVKQMT